MKKFFRDIFLSLLLLASILSYSNWATLKELFPKSIDLPPSQKVETPSLSAPPPEKINPESSDKAAGKNNPPRFDEPVEMVDLTTKLTREQALKLYQRISDALPEAAKPTFQIIFDLMAKGKMPVFYPGAKTVGGPYFEMLQFNPRAVINPSDQDFQECDKRPWNSRRADWLSDCLEKSDCPPATKTGVIMWRDDSSSRKCASGNFLHLLGKGPNEVDLSYGSSIIQSGPGDENVKISDETTIFILQKNWGKDTVAKGFGYPKWLEGMKDSPAKEEWKKSGFQYPQFIVFGPGILPQDLQWDSYTYDHVSGKKPIVLKNIKTGDQITFTRWPQLNFVFFEDGKFESWLEFGEKEDKRRAEEARQKIEDLKIPQRYGERLKNCAWHKDCYLSLVRDVAKDIDDPRKKCEIEGSLVLAKFKAEGSVSVEDAIAFATEDASRALQAGDGNPGSCKYDTVRLALGLVKSGKTDEALKLVLTDGKISGSRATTGRTEVVREVVRGLIDKKRDSTAIDLAIKFLQEHYAASTADLLLVVDSDFYHLVAKLNYNDTLKGQLPSNAGSFSGDKETRAQLEKFFRLMLIVAFDDKNFPTFDQFLPSDVSAETKAGLYFMTAAQMAYAKKENQLTFFLSRGLEESKHVSNLEKMRRIIGNTYLPLMLGDRKEQVFGMARILNTSPEALYALSVVTEGAQRLKEKNFQKSEEALRKANILLPQIGSAESFSVDFKDVHARFTKEMVEYLLIEIGDAGKAKEIFDESKNANPKIKEDEWNKQLAAFYAQQDVDKAFRAADSIVDLREKMRAYQAIASNAEKNKNKKILDRALNAAAVTFKNTDEGEKSSLLMNLHLSALSEANKSYALAELLASLGSSEDQDWAYERIALSAAKDKDVARALRNVAMIKSEHAKSFAPANVARALAASGFAEEALKFDAIGGREKLEIVKQWAATRQDDAAQLAASIKDPHIFAQAALAINDNVSQ